MRLLFFLDPVGNLPANSAQWEFVLNKWKLNQCSCQRWDLSSSAHKLSAACFSFLSYHVHWYIPVYIHSTPENSLFSELWHCSSTEDSRGPLTDRQ